MPNLSNKSITVTGGGSGIGRASALLIGQGGGFVTVADINGDAAAETAQMIVHAGGRAQAVRTDVASEADIVAMSEAAVGAYGKVDGTVICAARPSHGLLIDQVSLDQWNDVIKINLTAPFLCMKYQIPHMIKAGGGSIVLVSSAAAMRAMPTICEYSAAKAGLGALARSGAVEYGGHGIRVNAVLPGVTDTPMQQGFDDKIDQEMLVADQFLKRIANPLELGAAISWLLSDEASFVTGIEMPVDGGMVA